MSETPAGAEIEKFAVNGFKIKLEDGHSFESTSEQTSKLLGILPQHQLPLDRTPSPASGLSYDQISQNMFGGSKAKPAEGWKGNDYMIWTDYALKHARKELGAQGYAIRRDRKTEQYYVEEAVELPMTDTEIVAVANALLARDKTRIEIGEQSPFVFEVPGEVRQLGVDVTEHYQQHKSFEEELLTDEKRKQKQEEFQRGRVRGARKLKWLAEQPDKNKQLDTYGDANQQKLAGWLTEPQRQQQFSGLFYSFLADKVGIVSAVDINRKAQGVLGSEKVWRASQSSLQTS